MEAISAGVPVLVSKYSGLAEALREVEGGNAAIVTSDSYNVWATAIKKKKKVERKLRLDEAKKLRKKFGEKYSWSKEAERLSTILMELIKGTS